MKKFKAFTLAEVLIVLTIIGVIAALTMPILIGKIGDIVLENQRKKAVSVLSNGVKMLIAQSGSANLQDTDLKKCGPDRNCIAAEIKKAFKVTDEVLNGSKISEEQYLFEDSTEGIRVWDDLAMNYAFTTSDGMIFGVIQNQANNDNLYIYADVNGLKNPNEGGKDFCLYSFNEVGSVAEYCNPYFAPPGCSTRNPSECSHEECNNMYPQLIWYHGSCIENTQR